MREIIHTVSNPLGIHARPASKIAQVVVKGKSEVVIHHGDKIAYGGNVLQILALEVKFKDKITITIEGEDEDEICKQIRRILTNEVLENNAGKPIRIAFFGAKDYDKMFFEELSRETGPGTYNSTIEFFDLRLTEETAFMADGFDAVCIFVNDDCSKRVIEILKECGVRLILLRCAGFNNVDLTTAMEYGITILRVPEYSPYAVAEHAMAILQEANRRLHLASNKVRYNNFALSGLLGTDLHNKIAGIVGTGKIGQAMANICKGYGMTVIAWDKYPNQSLVDSGLLTYVEKDELFEKADLISLHAPLIIGDNGTYHMINKETISLMKDGVMLVNTARGGLIDTNALIEALRNNKFQAVALDVYEGEDENVYLDRSEDALENDITARLQIFPQLVLTSHQAFFTREALQSIAVVTMENARNFAEKLPYGDSEVK